MKEIAVRIKNNKEAQAWAKYICDVKTKAGNDPFVLIENVAWGNSKYYLPLIDRPVLLEKGCTQGFGIENYEAVSFNAFAQIAGIEVKEEIILKGTEITCTLEDGCVLFSRPIMYLQNHDLEAIYTAYQSLK